MSTALLSTPLSYENRLDADPEWALSEGSRHFEGRSAVHHSLTKITRKLAELGIRYAVTGGMALFRYGFRRFTEDVDLIVSKEGLRRIHTELEGQGFLPVFVGSKDLRDAETGVRIEFCVSGQFPGDGESQAIVFPDPTDATLALEGVTYLSLPKLIELKLASGITNSERLKDLGDVQELIKLLHLLPSFAEKLHSAVRGKYDELWRDTLGRPRRYHLRWRNRFLTTDAQSLPEIVEALRRSAEQLQSMLNDGVILDSEQATGEDYACLMTNDPDIARKYDMHEESEFFSADDAT